MKKKPKDTKQLTHAESTKMIEQRLQEALAMGFTLGNTDGGGKIFVGGLPGKPPEKKQE